MNRRFGAVFRWYIELGASGGQNVQDTVEQPAGVTSGSADMRLCWGEVFLDNLPEIIVNFPEYHDPRFYLGGLIILGSPREISIHFPIFMLYKSIIYYLAYLLESVTSQIFCNLPEPRLLA
jgi:hypothetical protein